MSVYDALVIGGGPAGATTAALLAGAGWSVALVEKARFPRRKVCGEYISAPALAWLHELALGDALIAAAGPEVREVAVYAGERAIVTDMPVYGRGAWRYGRAVGRDTLDALLLAHAARAGTEVWQPCRAVAVRGVPGAFECDVADEGGERRTLAARAIVAAHGSWEPGRLRTQPARRTPRASDVFGFKAYFRGAALPCGRMPLLAFPGGYGGMVHASGNRVSVSCCVRRDALAACRARDPGAMAAEAVWRHVLASNRAARMALNEAVRDGAWLASGPIAPGVRRSPQAGMYRVGNAAGEAHPAIAEGISMAVQSGALLCEILVGLGPGAAGDDWQAAGDAYERRWRALFSRRIALSACCAQVAMRPALAAPVAALLAAAPALIAAGARWSGKCALRGEG